MTNELNLTSKTKYDTIRTTNHVLETISKNMFLMSSNNVFRGMTKKQHEFLTFVLKQLQVEVNKWNNTYIESTQFMDLPIEDKVQILQEHNPFFTISTDEIIPFLKATGSHKFRKITKQEALKYIREIQNFANQLVVCQDIYDAQQNRGNIISYPLFSATSLDYSLDKGKLITINHFDLLINPAAYEVILNLFNALDVKGFGSTIIEVLLDINSVYAKNLWFFISRFSNYIDRPKGNKYSTKLLYSVLSGEEKLRYQDLTQSVKILNKVLTKYLVDGEPVQLEIEPTKKKDNKITEVALRCINLQELINSYSQYVQRERLLAKPTQQVKKPTKNADIF